MFDLHFSIPLRITAKHVGEAIGLDRRHRTKLCKRGYEIQQKVIVPLLQQDDQCVAKYRCCRDAMYDLHILPTCCTTGSTKRVLVLSILMHVNLTTTITSCSSADGVCCFVQHVQERIRRAQIMCLQKRRLMNTIRDR